VTAPSADPPLHAVLVHPEIPWNTGNAGRSCLAAGARLHLVRPLGFSLVEREVRRAGLDYWDTVAPQVWPSWEELEVALPSLGEPWLFSAAADTVLWDVDLRAGVVLVFGGESAGFAAAVRERYRTRLVRIPMARGGPRSLNLSTAVAVALYEALRQRRAR
jgi:tRNA (cytidine/uridine-2'-O-)-methyltransferase